MSRRPTNLPPGATWWPEGQRPLSGNPTSKAQEAGQPYPPGDPLDRTYTWPSLARAVVDTISGQPRTVLDPSVGGGWLLQAAKTRWPGAAMYGVDIDTGAAWLGRCHGLAADWLTVARFWDRLPLGQAIAMLHGSPHESDAPDLILMNPPFSSVEMARDHVRAALDLSRHVVAILPLPFVCGTTFDELWRYKRPTIVRRITTRPWPDRLREACVFEWNADWSGGVDAATTQLLDLDWTRDEEIG